MDAMDKLQRDLAAVIKEISSPLISAEELQRRSRDCNYSCPPAYDTVNDTVAKWPSSIGDTIASDSTERKFTHITSGGQDSESDTDVETAFDIVAKWPATKGDTIASDSTERKFTHIASGGQDSESDTDVETVHSIKDKKDLLKQIENLHREQEDLRQKQNIHEQHIKELLDREPCVDMRFKSFRQSFSMEENSKLFNQLKNASVLATTPAKQQHSGMTEQHIHVQLEQLYANFHVLHFPSKTAQSILGSHRNNNSYDANSTNEIMSLKNKIKELEEHNRALSSGKGLALLSPVERFDEPPSPSSSNKLHGVPGRPTSPLPLPPVPKDLCTVEVTFKWIISRYSKKLRLEKRDNERREISCPFYLTHCGYRAQIEAYLNGNGTGINKCMSIFLRIVKGEYDRHLKWPVNMNLVVILVNQSGNHTDSLKAEGNQFQYNKPYGTSDGESDCWGLIEFATHDMIKHRQYISDDKIVLKCRVQLL